MKRKHFILALVAMLMSFSFSAYADDVIVVHSWAELKAAIEANDGVQRSAARQRSTAMRTTSTASEGTKTLIEGTPYYYEDFQTSQIKLGNDVVYDDAMPISKNNGTTLDLNGYKVLGSELAEHAYPFYNYGKFLVVDNSEAGTGAIYCGVKSGIKEDGISINEEAVFVMTSGNIICTHDSEDDAAVVNYGIAYITGGTIEGANNAVLNQDGATMNILQGALITGKVSGTGISAPPGVYTVAQIGTTKYGSLQAAINAAVNGDVITLVTDASGDVTVTQAPDVKFTIDGKDKKFTGTITVDGKSARYETAGLTIKNVNFDATAGVTYDACVRLGAGTDATRYTNNVTIEGCTFTDNDYSTVAIKSYTGGDYNVQIIDCTAEGMHSLAQLANVEKGLVISGNTANTKNGINLNQTYAATIEGNTINVQGYAVRAGVNNATGGNITLTNNTLKTNNTEGDPAIELRGTVEALNMTKNVVSGDTHIKGTATTIAVDANYWDGDSAPRVVDTPIFVNSYYSDASLADEYLMRNASGSINAFVYSDRITGDVTSNAANSLVIEVIGTDGNVIGKVELENEDYLIGTAKQLTWRINLGADDSGSWAMTWNEGAPSITNMPAKVKLYVDGKEEAVAEAPVKLTANGDGASPVFAAKIDAEGKILSFIACEGEYNLDNANAKLAEVAKAAESGDAITLIEKGDYTMPEFAGKELTIKALDRENTSITDYVNKGSQGMTGSTVHFVNLTINGATENYYGLFHTAKVTYTDCVINGLRFLYANEVSFDGCTFNAEGVEHSFWTYGASNVTVKNSTFTYTDRAVNCYSENGANHETDITFENCSFTYAGTAAEPEGAVEINSGSVKSIDVDFNSCTAPANGAMWFNSQWDSKEGDKTIVRVDGNVVWSRQPRGNDIVGYVSETRIWGETWGNAVNSYVVKVLDANDNVMGTTSLNKVNGIINGDVKVTWGINFVGESTDPYWIWSWTTRPSIDNMPAKVQLWIDGGQVSEGDINYNAPDNLKKIVAATADADGNIIGCYTTLADACAAGNNVAILVAGTYSVPTGKDLTITGAVEGVEFGPIAEPNMGMKNYTFNNVTFNYANDSHYKGLQYAGTMVYNNCTFNGQVFLYGQSETFNKCTFNQENSAYYNVWTYSAKDVAFNECTFNSAGKSVLVYHEAPETFNNVAVTNTTFNASAPVEGKAAIEMDASRTAGANVTITNSTAKGFDEGSKSGSTLWNNKMGNDDDANNDITVTVDGDVVLQPVFDAQIGTAQYRTLTEAISAVKDGETITLLRDVAYDVTITQTADVDVTIDGNGKKFDGTIYLQGNSRHTGAETLTIKNVNFMTKKTQHDFISSNTTDAVGRYAHNVTIKDCNFTAPEETNEVVAARFRQAYNIKIEGGEFTNLHSVMWTTGTTGAEVVGVTATGCKEGGVSFGTSTGVAVKNVNFDCAGYGIRVDASVASSLTVTNSKIKAFIPVVARYATADYAIVMADNNEFTATNNDYLWCAVGATEYKENGAVPSDATGVVTVALNGTGLVANGVNGLKARIGNVYYFSYEKAYEAAQPGETVTILAANITGNLDVDKKAITVQGETDAEGNNLVNYTGKLNITADGATVKNINFNNGFQTAGCIKAKDVTVDGCQVVGGNGFRYCYTEGTVTFKNSVITGATYGIHFDGSANGNIVIDNCTITGWTSFASTITKVTMKDTRFDNGNYNYVRFYQKEVEISGCKFNEDMTVDLATNEANVTVNNCTVENKTVEDLFYGEDIVNSTITVDGVELIRIAKVGDVYYETITEAINAAADGATVEILAGEHSEYVAPWAGNSKHDTEKSITIVGAADFATTLTAGMYLGYDDSQCREHDIVVKGIVFKGKGLKVACQQNVTIKNNKFIDITEGQAIAVVGENINSVVKNNVIENVAAAQGIELRNTLTATVEGNTISGTAHNSLQITSQVGATNSTATVLNNTLSDWGLGGEGRAMRINGIVTATVNGNVMTHSATAPEEYVKVTSATTLDASKNYWAGVNPITDGMFNTDMVADRAALLKNYYVDADKQTLADISASPVMIGETYYRTFAAALDAVQDGETIELTGAAGSELKTEIEFTKDIAFTITGTAPQYALPVITFLNAEVTIKNAEILIPELNARQNATINVVNSTVHDAGGNSIAKSYYNGAINIDETSTVYMMQVTTMGYINVAGTLNATWQTNVYGNGLITLTNGATFNTAALHLTAEAYKDRDNTDADRVGKPATIIVDGATLNIGKVKSNSGADYSYNSSEGINVGTIDGKSAVLDIKNGGAVNVFMANGETANIGANGTVNVNASTFNVACRAAEGTATLANAGTVYVTGASNLAAAKVTGAGWFYMNGVNLDADTKLVGAKVGFINGENTVVGSTIKDGFFSVGIGQNAEAEKAAAFALANGIELGDVTVNVLENANIGGNGEPYSGWVGSAYSADKTQHTYALNVENSLAAFGYMHVSKDGTFTVDGRSADNNRYTNDNANVNFYAGELIINGVVTLNNADAWAKFTKMSVDATDGILNINGDTKFESSIHNGGTSSTSLKFWQAGKVNVAKTATVEIDNGTVLVDGAELNIAGNVTAKGAITGNGAINFTAMGATLAAQEGLTINHPFGGGYQVERIDGVYRISHYVASVDGVNYESLEAALKALTDGATLTFLEDITVTEAWDCRYNGAKITAANVTIDGNGKTLKLTGAVDDKNWNTVFRFEGDNATVKNLTIDASAATGIQRGITAKFSITVNKCTIIGNGTTAKRAIIFGEGAGTSISNVVATVTNSTFKNWSYGVSDNQNNQDAKSVTVSNNIFNNASVLVSASENVTFEDNVLKGAGVNITSYTNPSGLRVHAAENTLDGTQVNKITVDPSGITAQGGFSTPVAKVDETVKYYLTLDEAIAAANGNTVTVLDDIRLATAVEVNGKATLNLNGNSITPAADATMTGGPIRLLDGAELTINGEGEISNNGNENVYAAVSVLGNNVKLTVNGGKLIGHYYGIAGNGYKTGTEVTINGGVITSGASDGLGIYHPQAGILKVIDGEITGATGIYFKGGKLDIKGGTIKGTGASVGYEYNGSGCVATGDALVIENAAANGYAAIDSVSITGGTFHSVNAAPVASYAPEASDALVEFIGEGCGALFNNTFDESLLVVGYQLTKAEGAKYFGVEHTYRRESLTIVDGAYTEFVNEAELSVDTLTYERTFSNVNAWQSLYVPFEIPVEELTALGYEAAYLYDVHSKVTDGTEVDPSTVESIHLVKIKMGTLRANYPYMIRATKDADLNLSLVLKNTTLFTTAKSAMNSVESSTTTTRYIFAGTYTRAKRATLTGDDNTPCYAIWPDGIWYPMSETNNLGAFRVFMYIEAKNGSPVIVKGEAAQSIKMRVIGEENEDGTTTIYDLEADYENVDYIYDLQGRRVLEPQEGGLYIVNGKKVLF